MSRIWMSSALSPAGLGFKQGSRPKFYNHDWNPASFDIPVSPDEVYAAYRRHREGYALQRSDFPEAEAVFDEKRFSKRKDLFFVGPFFAVQGKLAEVFYRFDLGDGGLIPFTIYKADLETPYPGEFFLLNFGCRKNTILPEQCGDARKFAVDHKTGIQIWDINYLNPEAEVILSVLALDGADLWYEKTVLNKLFMSDALAQAIIAIGMKDIFKLHECRIAGDAQ